MAFKNITDLVSIVMVTTPLNELHDRMIVELRDFFANEVAKMDPKATAMDLFLKLFAGVPTKSIPEGSVTCVVCKRVIENAKPDKYAQTCSRCVDSILVDVYKTLNTGDEK